MVDMIKVKLNGKWDLILPEHRAARPEWKTGWEKETLDALEKNILPTDIVFEIGAEEGDMSALIAKWCIGRIVLFEPNPKVWPNLRAIWEANNIPMPLGYFVGFAGTQDIATPNNLNFELGEKNGWPTCAYGEVIGNHGFRHLAEEADSTPQIKIDTYVRQFKILPNVITMDIEGAEFEALKGAEETLKYHHPIIFVSIHPEFMNHHFGQFEKELHVYLENLGYQWKHLAYDHEHHYVFWHPKGKQYVG